MASLPTWASKVNIYYQGKAAHYKEVPVVREQLGMWKDGRPVCKEQCPIEKWVICHMLVTPLEGRFSAKPRSQESSFSVKIPETGVAALLKPTCCILHQ